MRLGKMSEKLDFFGPCVSPGHLPFRPNHTQVSPIMAGLPELLERLLDP